MARPDARRFAAHREPRAWDPLDKVLATVLLALLACFLLVGF
jgi:hypothetical protein